MLNFTFGKDLDSLPQVTLEMESRAPGGTALNPPIPPCLTLYYPMTDTPLRSLKIMNDDKKWMNTKDMNFEK